MSEAPGEVTHTDSSASDHSHHKPGSFWTFWAIALLLIYALSIGPVAKFCNGRPAPNPVRMFYWPLLALYSHIPAFHSALDWYFHLWGIP